MSRAKLPLTAQGEDPSLLFQFLVAPDVPWLPSHACLLSVSASKSPLLTRTAVITPTRSSKTSCKLDFCQDSISKQAHTHTHTQVPDGCES